MATAPVDVAIRLARERREQISSFITPIYWVNEVEGEAPRPRNGTMFFVDLGDGPIGVTACHVFDEYMANLQAGLTHECCILGARVRFDNLLIARNREIDIATFRLSPERLARVGKRAHTHAGPLPTGLPGDRQGVFLGGFPAASREGPEDFKLMFGMHYLEVACHRASNLEIVAQVERDRMIALDEEGLPPEGYKFGGISGAPLLMIDGSADAPRFSLAGVVIEGVAGGETSLDMVKARPAMYIRANGELNGKLWADSQPPAWL